MNYPALSMLPDGDTLNQQDDNPALEGQDTDGAYFITRPRYTRTPPRTFMFAYSDLSKADRDTLSDFFRTSAKGSSVAFNWTHPVTAEVINVRFSKGFKLETTRWGGGAGNLSRYKTNTISITEV
jgi:hypothetical protein